MAQFSGTLVDHGALMHYGLGVGRTIWIGDVHGCARELGDLLNKLGPGADDRVAFVGDLVARGPDTPGVIRLVRECGGLCVLGNHEHRLLVAHAARKVGERGARLGPSHAALLDGLNESEWEYLAALPLSLEFPDHGVRVVHAGVVPGVPWAEQQAWSLLHMRSLTGRGAPSDRYSSESWAASYNEEPHIVFGHNSQAGLQFHPSATGLDTGCVYGGALTALVLPKDTSPPSVTDRRDCIVSVPSHDRYVDFGPRSKKDPFEA